ncbi:hypothetical protein EVAR_59852_1 [Eumeta japonica]|uniref:Uncharacterized protein n=1 Tax=Eumeta variegata TaxID=151549 RepID=A0A4C1Z5B4_EUMVA|nr:hypothetical protein EVAR_59852_1 [Eumeta japonica]
MKLNRPFRTLRSTPVRKQCHRTGDNDRQKATLQFESVNVKRNKCGRKTLMSPVERTRPEKTSVTEQITQNNHYTPSSRRRRRSRERQTVYIGIRVPPDGLTGSVSISFIVPSRL